LHQHHIVPKSQGGGNENTNIAAVCPRHHAHGIHAGRIRLTGKAPERLRWEFRFEPGGAPFASYDGQRRVYPVPPTVAEIEEVFGPARLASFKWL
jgi:hypothetical protein